MVEALATLRSPDGRVLIDGFYDDVIHRPRKISRSSSNYPFDEDEERERLGADVRRGVTGPELLKRYFFEPTCNIAGIIAGFTVPGASKTVLPKEAMAKLDMRLVPDQDPYDIVDKLRTHLDTRGFDDIEINRFSMEYPVRSEAGSLIARAAIEATEAVFDQAPAVAPMMIATGPMHVIAARPRGADGFSRRRLHRPDSDIHAPNENCRVDDFVKIIEYTVAYLDHFARSE